MTQAETRFDIAIIGAGPAGISAALRASAQGFSVVVFDEQARAGGQIFRQPPKSFAAPPSSAYKLYPFGKALVEAADRETAIDWRFRETVWGIFPQDNGVVVMTSGGATNAEAVIVATGAYEMPVAFPGWTMPGVMGVGAIQTLVKSQFVLPGQRFVLAGSHPLLILVADLLVKAGANVLEVAIARPFPGSWELLKGLPAMPGNLSVFRESGRAIANLLRHRVPVRFGRMIVRADGEGELQNVTLADCDADWRITGGQTTIEADVLGIGYGLLASSELCRQAGCEALWSSSKGGWIASHDETMRTTVPRIYVAGEPAGIGGAALAAAQGDLAALGAMAEIAPERSFAVEIDKMKATVRKRRRFSDTVATFFEPKLDRLVDLASDDTLVCRCEEVSAGTVRDFLRDNPHVTNVNSVKLACRTGMGFCQGRYCQHTLAHILSHALGVSVAQCGTFTVRAPVKPITIGALAGNDDV